MNQSSQLLGGYQNLYVSAFIPYEITKDGWVSPDYDTDVTRKQLASVFAALFLDWTWQPITFENMQEVVQNLSVLSKERNIVVVNFCDGDDINGYPGISVIKLLEAHGMIFTGANSNFYDITNSKIVMKKALLEAGVSTAPYAVILEPDKDIPGICDRLGTPLIVKPAISAGSSGISLKSVVSSDEKVRLQFEELLKGKHGYHFSSDSIFVEKFINGQEFTVLVLGSASHPEKLKFYPAIERVFPSNLPDLERFLSFDRYWDIYEEETPLAETFCSYQLATEELQSKLTELSLRAFSAVGGSGYGRVDIRMERETQELFVLEVNANCGISDDEKTSVGNILLLSDTSFPELMSEIIAEAFCRVENK